MVSACWVEFEVADQLAVYEHVGVCAVGDDEGLLVGPFGADAYEVVASACDVAVGCDSDVAVAGFGAVVGVFEWA